MEKRNSQLNTDSQWSKQEACFACATQVWLAVNHNTKVIPLLANEFNVQSVLHGQVNFRERSGSVVECITALCP